MSQSLKGTTAVFNKGLTEDNGQLGATMVSSMASMDGVGGRKKGKMIEKSNPGDTGVLSAKEWQNAPMNGNYLFQMNIGKRPTGNQYGDIATANRLYQAERTYANPPSKDRKVVSGSGSNNYNDVLGKSFYDKQVRQTQLPMKEQQELVKRLNMAAEPMKPLYNTGGRKNVGGASLTELNKMIGFNPSAGSVFMQKKKKVGGKKKM